MDPDAYRRKLEADILQIMEQKLLAGEMDAGRARSIARMLLDKLHPPLTLEQIHQIAPTLDDHFQELTAAVLPVIADHQQEIEKIVGIHAAKLIKLGKINEATALMQKVNNKNA